MNAIQTKSVPNFRDVPCQRSIGHKHVQKVTKVLPLSNPALFGRLEGYYIVRVRKPSFLSTDRC